MHTNRPRTRVRCLRKKQPSASPRFDHMDKPRCPNYQCWPCDASTVSRGWLFFSQAGALPLRMIATLNWGRRGFGNYRSPQVDGCFFRKHRYPTRVSLLAPKRGLRTRARTRTRAQARMHACIHPHPHPHPHPQTHASGPLLQFPSFRKAPALVPAPGTCR